MNIDYIPLKLENPAAVAEMSDLAASIVKEVFDPIIGAEQNDYMIKKFQTVEAITEQLSCGYRYYFAAAETGEKIGFLAFYPRGNELYLSKFYLKREFRGRGLSKDMFSFVVACAGEAALTAVTLNVNRNNPAVFVYEKLGFEKIREEKNDIGSGFFMDDFVFRYYI